ncbi:calcium-binding and coiled-coil domain-containing protein 1-like [Anneissia japonica]|uniref:calcium-binding and coiled-coil domain-containing protein 1-like n=1 Tax=Anneissia japonica TaxID=1529436 RepID=UPI0014256330|nr:calcium-binding and coiled-coil domain-containing protein 1-like [Anneissia japonica]
MAHEFADDSSDVFQKESGEDVPIYGSFGADPTLASSEPFQALKGAYEHIKQSLHSTNDKCKFLTIEMKKLQKENEKLKQSNESLERINSFEISPEVADKNKIYLLNTKIEELTRENSELRTSLPSQSQAITLTTGNEQFSETQCQSKDCLKRIQSLENINKGLTTDSKLQENKIKMLNEKLLENQNAEEHQKGNLLQSSVSEKSKLSGIYDIICSLNISNSTEWYAELQQIQQEIDRKLTEISLLQGDSDMETDGNEDQTENADMVEFDVGYFLSDYKKLKEEVKNLLHQLQYYRELNQAGMLNIRSRKKRESDSEMEDDPMNRQFYSRFRELIPSSSIKRPPKEELGTAALGEIPPSLEGSEEDLYGGSPPQIQQSSTSTSIYGQGFFRAMRNSEENSPMVRLPSSSYGAATNVPAMRDITHFGPGSAPTFSTSGRMGSAITFTHGIGSPVASQSQESEGKFKIPIMQETGEGLLPPRNPPNLQEDLHAAGRSSPEVFTPAALLEEQKKEAEAGDMTPVDPEWTSCPMCSRQFDRSLFSAEFINHHVNSHFDGSSEYEFVDILQ